MSTSHTAPDQFTTDDISSGGPGVTRILDIEHANDQPGTLTTNYGAAAFPYFVLVDTDGTVMARRAGYGAEGDVEAWVGTLWAQSRSVTPTTVASAPASYTAKGVTIIDSGKGPMIAFSLKTSLPPQGGDVPLANLNWSMVDGEQSMSGTTWGGPYDVTGTWDGHTFTLTQPPVVPSTNTFPQVVPSNGGPTPGCTSKTVSPMLDALNGLDQRALGILEWRDDHVDGHCGVAVYALFDTTALRDAMAKVGSDVTLTFAFQPHTNG